MAKDKDGRSRSGKAGGEATKEKHGRDFYSEIGRKGGQNSHEGGFKDRELASEAGRKGGQNSRGGGNGGNSGGNR